MKSKLLSTSNRTEVYQKIPVTVVNLETGRSWIEYEDPPKARKNEKSEKIVHIISHIIGQIFAILWRGMKLILWLIGKLIPVALRISMVMASLLIISLAFLLPRW